MVDVLMLLELFDDNFEAVAALLKAATASIVGDFGRIEAAVATGDATIVANCAHRLAGTAGSISATRVRTAGSTLESIARGGALSAVSPLVLELKEAVGLTIEAIAGHLERFESAEKSA